MRLIVALASLGFAFSSHAQSIGLPDAPVPHVSVLTASLATSDLNHDYSSNNLAGLFDPSPAPDPAQTSPSASAADKNHGDPRPQPGRDVELDANGNPIPLERQQPRGSLVSCPTSALSQAEPSRIRQPGGTTSKSPPGRRPITLPSSFLASLLSVLKESNEHPVLGKGVGGAWAYTWRGFLDKTDGTYLSAWLMPSLLHEDTRFFALGAGHSIPIRALYVISRQGVARTYGGHQTPNIAGLGGKVLTQIVSRTYYPTGATSFPVLATKFGYSAMRDVMFTSIREFYPDAAAHFIRKHREKIARLNARADVAVY